MEKPGWQINLEQRIESTRRRLSFIDLILKCKQQGKYTSHQRKIESKLKKWYRKTTKENLTRVRTILKQDLKSFSEKLRRKKVVQQRRIINRKFTTNSKAVYRKFKAGENIEVKDPPTKEETEAFWKGIWGTEKQYNAEADWLPILEDEYCRGAKQKRYQLTMEILKSILKQFANNKTPGTDLIVMFWIKKLTATHMYLLNILIGLKEGNIEIPGWLSRTGTSLLPKNSTTTKPENYRPIAIQNNLYKVYTATLNHFLQDHCRENNIITDEQAAAKHGSWGCTDQLLVNKAIMKEVTKGRKNLFCIWMDYKKAFDSVPHDWLLKALGLAKVPPDIIEAIERLLKGWETKATLQTTNGTIETDSIKYRRGILQGDSLSVILYVLSVNPASFLLERTQQGYELGEAFRQIINHLFFVDDLKLYARSKQMAMLLLDIITTFTNDVGMKFGEAKCAYVYIFRGKRKTLGQSIKINNLTVQELKDETLYTYLGQDEAVGYNGPLNKDRVRKEYKMRVRKIWRSELYGGNKAVAHNTFAVPVITLTVGILDWTKEEIRQLDITTRKILNYTGNLHSRSDVNRIYVPRKQGGRGLTSIEDMFVNRIITLADHIILAAKTQPLMEKVLQHEQENIIRLKQEFQQELEISQQQVEKDTIKRKLKQRHIDQWKQKSLHGYLAKQTEEDPEIDTIATNKWRETGLSSHVEGYISAIQEQEIATKATIKRRQHEPRMDAKCRLCGKEEETNFHVIGCCSSLSSNLYVTARHDPVAQVILDQVLEQEGVESKKGEPESVITTVNKEIWWNMKIKTTNKVKYNRPDIMIWDKEEKTCDVVEITVPLEVNVSRRLTTKSDKYMPLLSELQQMYTNYKFSMIPVAIGSLGAVPKPLMENLEKLKITGKNATNTIRKIQRTAVVGTVKVMKTFMRMY